MKDKLNDKTMKKLLDNYDFIILTEIKTSANISCTGCTVYQHSAKQGHRGGVALVMKPWLSKFVKKIDKSFENVLTFEFSFMPEIVFVGCYISPSDSLYYDSSVFGHLQSLLKNDEGKKFFIAGDLNSRVGTPNLRIDNENLEYVGCNDDTTVNKNGIEILQVCEDNQMAVVNNLKYKDKHFQSQLSFRKKSNWISEPDILLASHACLDMINSFSMIQYFENKHLHSDHALLEFELNVEKTNISTELLIERALNLGKSSHEECLIKICKSLRIADCKKDDIKHYFMQNPPPIIDENADVDRLVEKFNNTVIEVLKDNRENRTQQPVEWGNQEKWTRLLEQNDAKKIWNSINWNGSIDTSSSTSPSDNEFRMHFEELLNPVTGVNDNEIDVSDLPYIPVLDDPISPEEVCKAANECKETKGFIGVTPAIFGCLPVTWIVFITQLLNLVFCSEHLIYPVKWCYNKLVVLFKKGVRLNCGNYRGLSISDTLSKLYGKIMSNRLRIWMYIDKCQAGGQALRGCIEHVLGLRLIIDYAKKERKKLFIVFVDFSKAYDRVPRKTLFEILKKLGCGKRFLSALIAIYRNTINILNSEYIRATIGVKQGGPMSCLLFVIYLNVLALMLNAFGNDSFLNDIHALMLMDDTVLLASSRKNIIKKFTIMMDFCKKYGMKVNELKTNLMVINGNSKDREEFKVDEVIVKHAKSYIYLGSPFTEDANINNVIKIHAKSRVAHLNKFKIFCKNNETMPFRFKKQVLMAMIVSSLLYACESWLTNDVKEIERMYLSAIKALLGVRETTRSDTVLLESGMPLLSELISKRTLAFAKKELLVEVHDPTPLQKIYKICEHHQSSGFKYLKNLMLPDEAQNIVNQSVTELLTNAQGSKAITYRTINPELKVHSVYCTQQYVNERARLTFTKLRLSSHSLKVETGRWSRIPRENRLCECGNAVEDEEHVLLFCPKTDLARAKFNVSRDVYPNIGVLMDTLDIMVLVPFVDLCMNVFK